MPIRICFEAQLRIAAGASDVTVDVPDGSTVTDALLVACQQCNDGVRDRLFADDHSIRSSLLIFMNDTPVPAGMAAATPLSQNATIVLCPPIAGG
ncbi:MAG: MoaD/ThiS family protein [Planctomycetaceae bacterium]|nr:MoaD/ThiS family protein [Planctomycetaceae bacterium]